MIKDDKLVGACLYGDTVDGSWYFKLLRDGRSVHDIRDQLMFGESNLGDAGHQGQNKAAAMPDDAEVCGCNGVSKGTICKAIKDKGLFTLDEVRKHTKASASCGSCTGLVEQILMFTAGGDYSATPKKKADLRLHRRQRTRTCAMRSASEHYLTHRRGVSRPRLAHAQRLRDLPPGDQLLPDLAPGPRRRRTIRRAASSTSAATPTSRRTAPIR